MKSDIKFSPVVANLMQQKPSFMLRMANSIVLASIITVLAIFQLIEKKTTIELSSVRPLFFGSTNKYLGKVAGPLAFTIKKGMHVMVEWPSAIKQFDADEAIVSNIDRANNSSDSSFISFEIPGNIAANIPQNTKLSASVITDRTTLLSKLYRHFFTGKKG